MKTRIEIIVVSGLIVIFLIRVFAGEFLPVDVKIIISFVLLASVFAFIDVLCVWLMDGPKEAKKYFASWVVKK